MGHYFSQSKVENDTYIVKTNEPITNLDIKITKIKFDSYRKVQILLDNNLTVETIDLTKCSFYRESLEHLPPKLKNFLSNNTIWKKIENFPQYLESLTCSDEFYIRQTKIPKTLKKLILTSSCIYPNDNFIPDKIEIPENLEELYFNYEYDEFKTNYLNILIKLFENLPPDLKILKIPDFWNYPLINLPTKLEKLYVGKEFSQSLDLLPESIKHIEFVEDMKFDKSLDNLPSQLEYLNLQFQNECNVTISNLPNSIKYLELGTYELEIGKLPDELVELKIASCVKFDFVKFDTVEIFENKKKEFKQIKYYELKLIGKYNIKNNFKILIPYNLSKITWYDDVSTYTFIKCLENDLWFEMCYD